jgi:hypothetical protein
VEANRNLHYVHDSAIKSRTGLARRGAKPAAGGREENQMRRIGSSDKSRPFRQEMGMIRFLQAL